jgi:hypothetical protein
MATDGDRCDEPPTTPPKPEGWRSAAQLRRDFVGHNIAIDNRLRELRSGLIADIVAAGYPEEEAVALVEHNLVGRKRSRRGTEATVGSPDAVRLLGLTDRKDTAPPKPDNWQSAIQLSKKGFGAEPALGVKLRDLHAALIADVVAAGYPEEEAVALVEHNLIGQKKPTAGGREAAAASPDAVRLLEREKALPRPEGWVSATDLSRLGKGRRAVIAAKLRDLHAALIADIVAAGYPEEEAIALVEHNLVGHRKTASRGPAALAISPDGLRTAGAEVTFPGTDRISHPTGRY